ncbi:MAG: carboxylating nicotinate-nucleotide diphosphorylase [Planctomycetes bacterium]|nr:carboxylating nicotinate-nucleotide diphosphorylase [Planctomycetota bacterium]
MQDAELARIVRRALTEDLAGGDVTTDATVEPSRKAVGLFHAKQPAVVAGLDVAREVFRQVGGVKFTPLARDGARVRKGQTIAEISGGARAILAGERTALNFLQRLSGVATLTRAFIEKVRGTRALVLDTRKTTPGLRLLEKRAVRAGGGTNHRVSLADAALIKDNHIEAVGDEERLREAVMALRLKRGPGFRIEIEAQTIDQALLFATFDVDVVMLDNLPVPVMRKLVPTLRKINPGLTIEASGGVTLKTVRAVAETGVDWISVGALTHSAPAVDISLELHLPRRPA